jgi:hypothetical protein
MEGIKARLFHKKSKHSMDWFHSPFACEIEDLSTGIFIGGQE